MTEKLDPYLDPNKNKCITCGLCCDYIDPKFDKIFSSLGKLHESGKINYTINRRINEPQVTMFCSAGLPQAMDIDKPCQFHQPDFGYSIEHYLTIYSATLTKLLTEETKTLTLKTNILAEDTKLLTAKTKRLAVIAIFISIVLGTGQLLLAALQVSPPLWLAKLVHNLLALFSCS